MRISFPGRPIFIQLPPACDAEVAAELARPVQDCGAGTEGPPATAAIVAATSAAAAAATGKDQSIFHLAQNWREYIYVCRSSSN